LIRYLCLNIDQFKAVAPLSSQSHIERDVRRSNTKIFMKHWQLPTRAKFTRKKPLRCFSCWAAEISCPALLELGFLLLLSASPALL